MDFFHGGIASANKFVTQYNVEGHVESVLHYMREHVFLSCVAVLGVYSIVSWLNALRKEVKVPRVYASDKTFLHRWTDPFRIITRGTEVAFKGYKLFPHDFFKVKFLTQTLVVVDRDHVKELSDAPESVFSFSLSASQFLQRKYTIGDDTVRNYSVGVVKEKLSRNIPALMDDIVDEVQAGLENQIPLTDDWMPVPAYERAVNVIARISNRVFVGLPLCRDPEYLRIAIGHSNTVLRVAIILRFFPEFLRRFVVLFFRTLRRDRKIFHNFLVPMINNRRQLSAQQGSDYKKPNDMLQWLMDAAKGSETSTEQLALRTITLNFASIHTTSLTFLNALYELAVHPEYVAPLREEIEAVTAKEGWTKASVMQLRKLDSFIKESIRIHSLTQYSLTRIAVQPFTFSNGVTIPSGTSVVTPEITVHMDESIYSDPSTFDPFRFSRKREQEGENAKHHAANTSPDYLYFGHGPHAWYPPAPLEGRSDDSPGRFFAINEIKLMLAFTLLRYDIKTVDGMRPKERVFNSMIVPDLKAKILYRRRR